MLTCCRSLPLSSPEITLPDDKILALSKFREFADDNSNTAQMGFFYLLFDGIANIAGKGENAGNQHFLLFQQCFQ